MAGAFVAAGAFFAAAFLAGAASDSFAGAAVAAGVAVAPESSEVVRSCSATSSLLCWRGYPNRTRAARRMGAERYSNSARTSAGMSALVKTFCTSSLSSRASTSRMIFTAPAASSWTSTEATNSASADS